MKACYTINILLWGILLPLQLGFASQVDHKLTAQSKLPYWLLMIFMILIIAFVVWKFKNPIMAFISKKSTADHTVTAKEGQSETKTDDKALYFNCFDTYKEKTFPLMLSYYLELRGKELNLSYDDLDILYAQYGKNQIFPNIQTEYIFESLPNRSNVLANEYVKIWAETYGITTSSTGVIQHMRLVLIKLSKEKCEEILESFLKEKTK